MPCTLILPPPHTHTPYNHTHNRCINKYRIYDHTYKATKGVGLGGGIGSLLATSTSAVKVKTGAGGDAGAGTEAGEGGPAVPITIDPRRAQQLAAPYSIADVVTEYRGTGEYAFSCR